MKTRAEQQKAFEHMQARMKAVEALAKQRLHQITLAVAHNHGRQS